MGPARNDPCPCGSGKKYKKCCYLREKTSATLLTPRLLKKTADKISDLLLRHSGKLYGPESLEDAWEEFWAIEGYEKKEMSIYIGLFLPWFLYHWFPDEPPFDQGLRFPSEETVVARFLADRSSKLVPLEVRFLESARREPMSFWQVGSVEPGKGLFLTDMVTGRECFAHDESSTNSLHKWDLILGQVVGLDGEYILHALGPYSLPGGRFRQDIENFIDHVKKGRLLDPIDLLEYDVDIIGYYHDCVDELFNPVIPAVVNTDGEELVFVGSSYSFRPEHRQKIIEKLKKLRNVDYCGDEEGGSEFNWIAKQKRGMSHGMIRGSITVGSDRVLTDCNSEQRNKKLSDKLLKHLGGWITHEETSYRDLDSLEIEKAPGKGSALDPDELTEDSRRELMKYMEQRYLGWIDEKIPALNDRTPKEAVLTPQGKVQVSGLINDWENMQLRNPNVQFSFDFNKLRSALGIDEE